MYVQGKEEGSPFKRSGEHTDREREREREGARGGGGGVKITDMRLWGIQILPP